MCLTWMRRFSGIECGLCNPGSQGTPASKTRPGLYYRRPTGSKSDSDTAFFSSWSRFGDRNKAPAESSRPGNLDNAPNLLLRQRRVFLEQLRPCRRHRAHALRLLLRQILRLGAVARQVIQLPRRVLRSDDLPVADAQG